MERMALSLICLLLMTSSHSHQDRFVLISGQFVLMATSARYALRSLARHSSRFGFVVRTANLRNRQQETAAGDCKIEVAP